MHQNFLPVIIQGGKKSKHCERGTFKKNAYMEKISFKYSNYFKNLMFHLPTSC